MVYNYPTNISGFGSLFQYINTESSSMFSYLIIMSVFIISFVSMKKYQGSKAFVSSAFITAVIAILFARIFEMNPIIIYILIVAVVVGMIWSMYDNPSY